MDQVTIHLPERVKAKIRDALVLGGCIAAALLLFYVTR